MQRLFVLLQYLTPQHYLSRLVALFATSQVKFIKTIFIASFIKRYRVNMDEAKIEEISAYKHFNDFFTRELKVGARPVAEASKFIVSPADGVISELGPLQGDKLLQAKGRYYSAVDLLGGDEQDAELFSDGSFITVYLSPRDYHRVHMPISGQLTSTIYVPGKLFSVNQVTADSVPNLFARNERLACFFETDVGPVAIILVGAMIVAGIDTIWAGQCCPNKHGLQKIDYRNQTPPVRIAKGAEMGRFCLGSTVIVLFGAGAVSLNQEMQSGSAVRLGEILATVSMPEGET